MKLVPSLLVLILLAACATTPDPQAAAEQSRKKCLAAERAGNLAAAEDACQLSLYQARTAKLGPQWEMVRSYNLGRIKRQMGKYKEAESLLRRSLRVAYKLSDKTSLEVGRRLGELSATLASQGRWREGALYLERMLPIVDKLQGTDRQFMADMFDEFATKAKVSEKLIAQFKDKAAQLRL